MTFLEQNPRANIFHHPAWSQLIAQCYHFRPRTFVLTSSQHDIVAGLPLMQLPNLISGVRWECLPFTDHCFPLFKNEANQKQLFNAILAGAREHRIDQVGFRGDAISDEKVYQSRQYSWHSLRLENDFPSVANRIHQMHKRNAITAEKRGVHISWGNTKNDIEAFYRLHLEERHRQGIPVQPKRFFYLIGELLFQTGLGSILFAIKEDKVIAGLLLLHYGQTLTYKFGASEKSSLVSRPNDLLFWTAIQWGCENHYRSFDMGRSDPDNLGLISFKQGWGAGEQTLNYYTTSPDLRARTPGNMSNTLRNVIRKSPPWVCRFIGELFYKYAG